MLVIFRRTGERRYGVEVRRPRFGDVEKSPAPGFDELMPHDLMHLVVEAELGLKRGIFGQLEAGGHAGTFRDYLDQSSSTREAARRRRHYDQRSAKLLREGKEDCAKSERATYICWHAWLARSGAQDRQRIAQTMIEQAKQIRSITAAAESQALSEGKMEQICRHLDELSSHWSQLKVGESMMVNWPDLSVTHGA
jgi:hypothetical protein